MWDWDVWHNAFYCSVVYSTQLVKELLMLYSAFAGGFSYKNAASFCRRRQLQKRVECKFNQGVYAHLCKFCSALHLPTKQYSMYNIVRTAHVKMLVLFHMYCDSVLPKPRIFSKHPNPIRCPNIIVWKQPQTACVNQKSLDPVLTLYLITTSEQNVLECLRDDNRLCYLIFESTHMYKIRFD